MKKNIILKLVTGAVAMSMMLSMVACGSKTNDAAAQGADQTTEEVVAEIEDSEAAKADQPEDADDSGMMDLDTEIQAVQDSLVYMGGLKTPEGSDKDMQFAIFRNMESGDLIGILIEDGTLHYGIFTTEDAKLDDGREYAKMTIEDLTYGYYFNEDLTTGILIDTENNVYDAVELEEDTARSYVSQTIGG